MPERQPGRPTEEEFYWAAVRFLKDDYEIRPLHSSVGYYTSVIQVKEGRANDVAIIREEQYAEGLPGERESIRDFAVKQLSHYQKSRKR